MVLYGCSMDRRPGFNAVSGLLTGGRQTSDPPNYWYFGDFSDADVDIFAEACLKTQECEAFTHILIDDPNWRNQCYGRALHNRMVSLTYAISGVKIC